MRRFALAAVVAAFVAGCSGDNGPDIDSQTNWLSSCVSTADCGDKYACVCGVCTVACDTVDACATTEGTSQCVPSGEGATAALCGVDDPAPGLCLPECSGNADCGDEQQCLDGSCVPAGIGGGGEDTGEDVADVGADAEADTSVDASEDADTSDACEDVPLPAIGCDEGFEFEEVYDDAGCIIDWACVPVECGPLLPIACAREDLLRGVLDGTGCPQLTCAQCGDAPDPGVMFCGDEEGRFPVLDDQGCIESWRCEEGGCAGFEPADCGDTEVAYPVYTQPDGCIEFLCIGGGSFPCGGEGLECDIATEYCSEEIPGVPGPTSFACRPLPVDICSTIMNCECLVSTAEEPADCRAYSDGSFQLTIAFP